MPPLSAHIEWEQHAISEKSALSGPGEDIEATNPVIEGSKYAYEVRTLEFILKSLS